jgi:hypothetical protein
MTIFEKYYGTPEKFADYVYNLFTSIDGLCEYCPHKVTDGSCKKDLSICKQAYINWLKSPTES